ncbi:MAG: aldo/keto reductase [Pseudonocardiaceae bacterium]
MQGAKLRYRGVGQKLSIAVRACCSAVDDGVLTAARELGVSTIAYSPLGRGFLTGKVRNFDALADDDFRRTNPRFADGNLTANLPLLEPVERLAGKLQLALEQCAGVGLDPG